MAQYAYDKYGNFIYGATDQKAVYYQSNIQAISVDYNTVQINWTPIIPDPLDGQPHYWALVKTFTGKPDNPYEGKIVAADSFTKYKTFWIESFSFNVDIEVNYSFWVFMPSANNGIGEWVYCGDTNTIIVDQTNTLTNLTRWIPRTWLNDKYGIGDSVGEPEQQSLYQVLKAYALEYDRMRVQTKLLGKSNTSKYITNDFAAVKQLDYGFEFERTLGDPYFRTLSIMGELVNSLKGTSKGISRYVNALTHIQNEIEIGHNLFLDYNDSSFEEIDLSYTGATPDYGLSQLGRWNTVSFGLAPYFGTVSYASVAPGILPPAPNVWDENNPPRELGLGFVTTADTVPVVLRSFGAQYLSTGRIANLTDLIPIKGSTRYIFSGWFTKDGSAGTSTVNAKINWYDSQGSLISTTNPGATITTGSSWKEVTSLSDGYRDGQLSPYNAAYASIDLTITGSAAISITTYFDMFQFCEQQYSLLYEDPRLIKIYLRGQEENILPNPDFTDMGLNGWILSSNATASVQSTNIISLSSTDGNPAYLYSAWMPVDPGLNYTFSPNLNYYPTLNNPGMFGIEFSNLPVEEDQVSITSFDGGQSYYYQLQTPLTTIKYTNYSVVSNDGTTLVIQLSNPSFDNFTSFSFSGKLYSPSLGRGPLSTGINATFHYAGGPSYNVTVSMSNVVDNGELIPGNTVYESGTLASLATKPYSNVAQTQYVLPTFGVFAEPGVTTISATAPAYSPNTGYPCARVFVNTQQTTYVGNCYFGPTLLVDRYLTTAGTNASSYGASGDLVSSGGSLTAISYFTGNGNSAADYNSLTATNGNPAAIKFYSTVDTFWETRFRYNFVSNSNFTTDSSGWSSVNSSTLALDTTTQIPTATQTLNVTNTGTGVYGAYTTVTLPNPAIGGENVVISAYVYYNGFDSVNFWITSPNSIMDTSSVLNFTNGFGWARITNVIQLQKGQTSFLLQINGQLQGVSDTLSFNISGVQAEFGTVASQFINLNNPGTFSVPNPANPAINMTAAYYASANAGTSSYIAALPVKYNRLFATLNKYTPNGSTFSLIKGWSRSIPELTDSLVPAASFETNLDSWTPYSATLKRVLYIDQVHDYTTHGIAYARATTTRFDNSNASFGLLSDKIYVNPNKSYYGSVAIRPVPGTGANGTYSIEIDAYDINDNLIQTFNNSLISLPPIYPGTNFTDSTTAPTSPTVGDRWLDVAGNYSLGTSDVRMYTWTLNDSQSLGVWAELDEEVYYNGTYQPNQNYIYFDSKGDSLWQFPYASNYPEGTRILDVSTNIGYISYLDGDGTYKWVEFAVVDANADVYLNSTAYPNYWGYLNIILDKSQLVLATPTPGSSTPLSLTPVSYIRLKIICQPDTFVSGQSFDVDRVIFR